MLKCFYILLKCFFRVNHSNMAIQKPLSKDEAASQREMEEAMKKVKEAQSLITAAAEGQG